MSSTQEVLDLLNARSCDHENGPCIGPQYAWVHVLGDAEWLDVAATWPGQEARRFATWRRYGQAVIWTRDGARLRWSGNANAWIEAPQS